MNGSDLITIGRSILGLLSKILLFVFLILLFASGWFVNQLLFRPPSPSYSFNEGHFSIPTTEGEQVVGRFLRNHASPYLVIYSHGNAEDLGYIENILQGYHSTGVNVLSYDYPGYGMSGGKASEKSSYRAIEAMAAFAIETLKFPPDRIVLHGRSVGSGPTIELATKGEFAGVIVESGITSAFDLLFGIQSWPWGAYKNLNKMPQVSEPTLVIHGTDDPVVPFSRGKALFEKSNAPKLFYWVDGGKHNDLIPFMGKEYWDILEDFVLYIDQDL